MSAFYSCLNIQVFQSCGILAAYDTQVCSKCYLAGEEIDAPMSMGVPAAARTITKKKCVGLWRLVSYGQSHLL